MKNFIYNLYNLFLYIYIISHNLLIVHYNIDHIYDGVHISISAVSQYEVVEPDISLTYIICIFVILSISFLLLIL